MLYFQSLHAFRGNREANQLSFESGRILVVKELKYVNMNNSHWSFGWLADDPNKRGGYFPTNYVERIPPPTQPIPAVPAYPPPPLQQPSAVTTTTTFNNYNSSSSNSSNSGWRSESMGTATTTATPATMSASSFPNLEDDEGFGFDGPVMGGSWKSLSDTPNDSTTDTPGNNNDNNNSTKRSYNRSWSSPVGTSSLSNMGSKFSTGFSKAASRTGAAFSSAASATKSAFQETGHRLQDISQQHQSQLDQTPPSHTSQKNSNASSAHERHFTSSSSGILPGRRTDTVTSVARGSDGLTRTTVTTEQKASGGFMPWMPGKITTTQTTTTDARGNTVGVQTQTKSGGGFYVIPLGPIGLAACGVMAAKNAYDAQKEKQQGTSTNNSATKH